MKRLITSILIACLAIAGPFASFPTGVIDPLESVSMSEAMGVAKNWVDLIIEKKGHWGGSWRATVMDCTELRRGERVLGYFCPVSPRGYLAISLYKVLAPVKFYSTTGSLDSESEIGMADLIKDVMERVLDALEMHVGPIETASSRSIQDIMEIDYRSAWDDILEGSRPGLDWADYQEGDVLLTSSWEQGPPYNDQCPDMSCTWPCNINTNALVGCQATAGAQIMRYWNWPPFGVGSPYSDAYDWPNMLDTVPCGAGQAQIDAVAEINYEAGLAALSTYGCGGTSASLLNMRNALVNSFRYDPAAIRLSRTDYTTVAWFNLIKAQLSLNRPVDYEIPNHYIVVDGWREVGATPTRELHINYGWGGGNDGWFTVDGIPGGDWPNWPHEKIVSNIVPDQALGAVISGTYAKVSTFPYRYFDLDATGSATFSAGQYLQFLPGIAVTSSGTVRFDGSGSDNTRLFAGGDTTRGIRIYDGAVKLHNNGSISLP